MKLHRYGPIALAVAGLVGLLVACFGAALFGGEQFAYRDAAHFYYPLYKVTQDEWSAGRVPLWDPWENGGMPLLATPTVAALYPGKLVYAALPYAWGARLYIVGHVLLAVAAMYALMRRWGVGRAGSAVAGLGYGFGMPVLFQYCNVIFLVGAAWMPLGLRAADRLVRGGRRWAIVELAAVLAMMVLGGDPQAAYVTGLLSAAYAVFLPTSTRAEGRRWPAWIGWGVAALLMAGWIAAVLAAGARLPDLRPEATETHPMPIFRWTPHVEEAVMLAWAIVAFVLLTVWRRSEPGRRRLRGLALLVAAAIVAGLLTAAQLLPTAEFTRLTARAAEEGAHDVYPFSVEPYRLLELLWPACFGAGFRGAEAWLFLLPPFGQQKPWVPSLYLGGPVLVLAMAGFGFRGDRPGRSWLAAIGAFGLLASLGTYTSPLWYARYVPDLAGTLGPHDPSMSGPVRLDGKLRDGDGGFYWLMAAGLPGFGTFRYPAKFLTVAALGLAGLAGLAWDDLLAGRGRRRVIGWAAVLLAVTIAAGVALAVRGDALAAWIESSEYVRVGSSFGPLRAGAVLGLLTRSLLHGGAATAAVIPLALLARRSPRWAGAGLLAVLAADLAVADARHVATAPQAIFDESNVPLVLAKIDEAERREPTPGPFRIHRMPVWDPPAWRLEGSDERVREFAEWERDTIQPKYAITFGREYTHTEGTAELYDQMFFSAPFYRKARPEVAGSLGVEPGTLLVYYPRRGFDLWNTRYFVVPGGQTTSEPWQDEQRGYAAFLPEATRIYPPPEVIEAETDRERRERLMHEDLQIYRNEAYYPRAWVVHELAAIAPIEGLDRVDRVAAMNDLLYPADAFWSDSRLALRDPRRRALIEVDDPSTLAPYNTGGPPAPESEPVEVVAHEPQRVALRATLDRPGLVVLADVYYPGWRLTIDGAPAPIVRTNRMMRGAAVGAGTHELVYTYDPDSFRHGCYGTAVGLLLVVGLAGWSAARPEIGGGRD